MSNSNYFHGGEAGQFSFFRIPRALMKDARFHGLSTDAKLLYGLMLDRMGLSQQNGWLDGENRVFIYFTLEEIQDTLTCGHNKAVRLLAELEKYALIERIKQGQGKPAKVYVKNFVSIDGDPGEATPEHPQSTKVKTSENSTSALPTLKPLDCPKGEGIYTDKNYTEFSYINLSINPKGQPPTPEQMSGTSLCCQDILSSQQIAPSYQENAPRPHSGAFGAAVRASMSSGSTDEPCCGLPPPNPQRSIASRRETRLLCHRGKESLCGNETAM